ncbi:MAG: radical SAM protein, partial [Candidatus Omnitrophica bacterium]|nr:radical SAM protein [Candidatus Omnitrophota bacterium]
RSHQVDIYDYNGCEFSKSLKSFFGALKYNDYDLIGISFNSFNRWGAYKIMRAAKKINKDIIVVLGGVHPSTMHGQICRYFFNDIDFIIQSAGEESFYRLCNYLEAGKDYKNISGLVYKADVKSWVANPVTEVVSDLDSLPIPDYSYAARRIKETGLAYLITSRGCPVNCSFCSTSSFWGQAVKMNSPERVGQEVDYVKSLGARKIFFHDDTFNLGIERTIKLAQVLKSKDIEYAISCRVRPVSEEMIASLTDSGCRHITWGVESLSDEILKTIDKKITKEEVKNAFDICAKFTDKLTTGAFFCVGAPGESKETVSETVDYLNKNIRSTHGPGASMLYILPGTKIYADLVRKKQFNERVWIKSASVYYYTKEHSMAVLNKWRKKINHSGIRIAYTAKYFWDSIPNMYKEQKLLGSKRLAKIVRKTKGSLNLLLKRY